MTHERPAVRPVTATIGARIATLRGDQDVSKAELARRLATTDARLTVDALTRIEHGERPLDVSEATAIATVLGVNVSTLFRTSRRPASVRPPALPAEVQEVAEHALASGLDLAQIVAGVRRRCAAELEQHDQGDVTVHHELVGFVAALDLVLRLVSMRPPRVALGGRR